MEGEGEAGRCSPISWREINFTWATYLKEQLEIWTTFMTALRISLILRTESTQPPEVEFLLRPCLYISRF